MRTSQLAFVPLTLLVAVACPRDADEPTTELGAVAPPRDPAAVPAAAQSISLSPLTGEPIVAEAVVLPIGAQTQVTIVVHQTAADLPITGHVMSGGCDGPGPTVADLQPLRTGGDGRGTSRTTVDVRPEVIANGNHLVQLRREDRPTPVPIACGEIELPPSP